MFLYFKSFSLFFVNFFTSLINETSHNTFLTFEKGAAEHILRGKIWLYCFDSVFLQVSIDFLVCFLYFLLFLLPYKN